MTASGVSTRRNRRTVKMPKRDTSTTKKTPPASPSKQVRDFRRRMECVGDFVREVFGVEHLSDPELLNRDAYLIVVSSIISALIEDHQTLSTAELAALSKTLAEQRRLDISQLEIDRRFPAKVPQDDTLTVGPDRKLPQAFARVVEQIYGTNLSNPSRDVGDDAAPAE